MITWEQKSKCKVWIKWDNFELDSHSVLWSVRPSEALSWGQQKTSRWYPNPAQGKAAQLVTRMGLNPLSNRYNLANFTYYSLDSPFYQILKSSRGIQILKCGFCKKTFIMNDFLRNPHFKARAMWPKDGATQSSDWFQ